MAAKKISNVRPRVTEHPVITINQHDVIDWLVDNDWLSDTDKETNLGRVEYLNPELMKYIASEMVQHIVESGAYDDAMTHIAESGIIDTFLRTFAE